MAVIRALCLLFVAGLLAPATAGAAPQQVGDTPEQIAPVHIDLRVMTWNIQHGAPNGGGPVDLERIANVIRTENPDVVTLNEVHDDEDVTGSHGHQPAILRSLLEQDGYEYAYYGVSEVHSSAHPGTRGEMILSKYPIHDDPDDPRKPEVITLPTQNAHPGEPDRRALVKVTLAVPGAGDVRVYATHLSPPASEAQILDQREQARKIIDSIDRLNEPVVLAGDLNIRPYIAIRPWLAEHNLVDTWTLTNNSADGVTRPNSFGNPAGDHPDRRIDYVYASPRFDVVDGHVSLMDRNASDHLAVVMDLRLRKPPTRESASLLAGETGESGWAHLALDHDGRAKLTVCKNQGTVQDDGWAVEARVYIRSRDEPLRVEPDGGATRDMCQTTSWHGYNPTGTALETCLVKGDVVKECRSRVLTAV